MIESVEQRLPPPNWSPTGNSGYWIWDEEYKQKIKGNFSQGAWRWHDDVYGLMTTRKYNKLNSFSSTAPSKKTFLTKAKNFFKIKK